MKQKAIVTVTTKLVLEVETFEENPIDMSTVDDYMCDMGYQWQPSKYHKDEDHLNVNEMETEIVNWNVESVETIKED